jgi:hypothetical protein
MPSRPCQMATAMAAKEPRHPRFPMLTTVDSVSWGSSKQTKFLFFSRYVQQRCVPPVQSPHPSGMYQGVRLGLVQPQGDAGRPVRWGTCKVSDPLPPYSHHVITDHPPSTCHHPCKPLLAGRIMGANGQWQWGRTTTKIMGANDLLRQIGATMTQHIP